MSVPAYNPAQQRVIDLLGRSETEPCFPAGLADELAEELQAGVARVENLLGDEPLWVSKHALASVHGCEGHHLATAQDFSWTVPRVRGQVTHKAIELAVNWRGSPTPGDLVDDAIARLADSDRSASRYLTGLPEAERAQLRGESAALVSKFQECFPPLKAAWWPVTESRAYVETLGGRVVLSGKVDLTLGRPEPGRATKVLIDLKSGLPSAHHRDDLRFYALLETLKLGTPPRKLASYYLDAGRAQPEEVTPALLRSALVRTVEGVIKLAELAAGRAAALHPGPACRWCPAADGCVEGQAWLWSNEDDRDVAP